MFFSKIITETIDGDNVLINIDYLQSVELLANDSNLIPQVTIYMYTHKHVISFKTKEEAISRYKSIKNKVFKYRNFF